jgi:hypothetical protein
VDLKELRTMAEAALVVPVTSSYLDKLCIDLTLLRPRNINGNHLEKHVLDDAVLITRVNESLKAWQ